MTNIKNRTIFEADNLDILRGINSDSIDLIYLDPPFKSDRIYSAPIGSEAAGAAFKDTWSLSDVDNVWHGEIADREPALYAAISAAELTHSKSMKAYLITMGVRLLEMRRILKDTGSIYLHCDPTAGHYLKMTTDAVFGPKTFVNEIIWYYKNASRGKKRYAKSHDVIFWYSKSDTPTFNRDDVLVPFESGMTQWRYTKGGQKGKPLPKGKTPDDVWEMPSLNAMSKERTGYPTQKPLALIERIIKASSNSGDMVLDPFCGCATTCIAAEKLNRQWVGIDLSGKALDLVKLRLEKELQIYESGGILGSVIHRTDVPLRTDLGELPNYRTHKHELYGEQEGNCNGCRVHFPFVNLTVDHIIAQTKGGTDHIDNLQLLCGYCNSLKGKRSHEQLLVSLKKKGM